MCLLERYLFLHTGGVEFLNSSAVALRLFKQMLICKTKCVLILLLSQPRML